MIDVKITPVSVHPDTATTLRVMGVQVRTLSVGGPGTAVIGWQLLTDAGHPLKVGSVQLLGKDYDAWGNDDAYVVDFVVKYLKLTKVS